MSAPTRVDALETLTAFNRRRCAFTIVRYMRWAKRTSVHAYNVYVILRVAGAGSYEKDRNDETLGFLDTSRGNPTSGRSFEIPARLIEDKHVATNPLLNHRFYDPSRSASQLTWIFDTNAG